RAYNAIMTRGEKVIAISAFIAGHMRRVYGVPTDKIRIIHRGVDLAKFDPARVTAERVIKLASDWRMRDGVPVVMLPGRLTRWKGQKVLIDAAARLNRKDVQYLLVGSDQGREGYHKELERQIAENGLNDVMRIVDHCNDMPAAYMLSDVVVSASTDPEAFGRVITEAQAMGRPVVATNHGGARETILEGETGWLVPTNDPAALAVALEQALSLGEAARSKMAERAMARIRADFSREAMCSRTLEVYDEVLQAKWGQKD
ncbi:MAG: glycosyltransferase, partial [Rhodospirillales bacterium]|nr:glycosyltransferase [Rhodospirillales bacterium]MCW8970232.1 glycosyltransferase [Rhodospirillales bacterium]